MTPNDPAALASTGFPLRSGGGPVGDLPAPGDLRAKAGDDEGKVGLRCKSVTGAGSYEWQCRLRADAASWQPAKLSTTVRITLTGLTPGVLYAFRVRAIGAAGPGAWSDEATCRVP